MIVDPIVEEVRRHRLARAAKFNFDIDAIAEDARKREGADGRKVIKPRRRRAGRPAQRKGEMTVG
jgi:hypothetical protein